MLELLVGDAHGAALAAATTTVATAVVVAVQRDLHAVEIDPKVVLRRLKARVKRSTDSWGVERVEVSWIVGRRLDLGPLMVA